MSEFNNFKTRTINQIRMWAWAAAILPLSGLAGLFFVWRFFDGSMLGYAMIAGETIMFTVAVIWWWWAMYVLRNLVKQWDATKENVKEVLLEVANIKSTIQEVFKKDK